MLRSSRCTTGSRTDSPVDEVESYISAPMKSASCAASGGLTVLGRVVRGQCDVRLSAKIGEPGILYARGNMRDDKYAAGVVRRALRDPDEVDVAVKCLRESGPRELSCIE